jgi:hypothetical protein
MNPREIVRASAGAGKTFRISSRIIGLLASDQPPSSILASTFTRKAAGEILDRVLVRVAGAVLDEKAARELGEQTLGTDQPDGVTTDTAFWARLLDRIVAELGMLEVSTLDSFFSRVLRAFSNEMGLLPGWTIADKPTGEGLRSEALEVLFDRQDDGILVELVRALHPGEVRRSIYARVVEDIDQIVAADREVGPDAPGWDAMRVSFPKLPDDVARRAADLAEQVEAAEVPLTRAGKPKPTTGPPFPTSCRPWSKRRSTWPAPCWGMGWPFVPMRCRAWRGSTTRPTWSACARGARCASTT